MKQDLRSLDKIDLKMDLLDGKPLYVDNIEIKQKTIREIREIGYDTYQRLLSIVTLDKFKLSEDNKEIYDIDKKTTLDIILEIEDNKLLTLLIQALLFFLDVDKFNYNHSFGLIIGDIPDSKDDIKVVNSSNFNYIVDAIKYINCVYNVNKDTIYNPQSERARIIAMKLQAGRKKVEEVKAKGEDKEDIDIADVISAVTVNSRHYDKRSVWDLTLYQLYDEFNGINKFVNYNHSVLSMMQGAKIDLKHWASSDK